MIGGDPIFDSPTNCRSADLVHNSITFTLIQTGKVDGFPVVLFGRKFWRGLLSWMKRVLVEQGTISPGDVDLVQITDDPEEVCDLLTRGREHLLGIEPLP